MEQESACQDILKVIIEREKVHSKPSEVSLACFKNCEPVLLRKTWLGSLVAAILAMAVSSRLLGQSGFPSADDSGFLHCFNSLHTHWADASVIFSAIMTRGRLLETGFLAAALCFNFLYIKA